MIKHLTHLMLVAVACCTLAACGSDDSGAGEIDASNSTSNSTGGDTSTSGTSNATTGGTSCTPGEIDCECAAGACSDGVCVDNTCIACELGNDGCPCFGNGTCGEGLRCDEEANTCEMCPAGEETCACDDTGGCADDLICLADLCVPETCQNSPGRVDCPCDAGNVCNEGLTCTEGGMCAECSTDIVGCACDDEGECTNDLVCDDDEETCREELACEDIDCVLNQQCDEGEDGADAICLEACLPGFEWNMMTGACDRIIEANCTLGAEGSLLDQCAALNRACVTLAEGAECGGCVEGFVDDDGTLETCRDLITCDEVDCAALNRDCVEAAGNTDAACGDCASGYQDDGFGDCELIPVANCLPDDPDSILEDCQIQNRLCISSGGGASCGDCAEGFADDNGLCVEATTCAELNCAAQGRECVGEPLAECGGCVEGAVLSDPNDPTSDCRDLLTCNDVTCEEGTFCSQPDGQDAECSEWPCTFINGEPNTNQAFNEARGECVDCNILCGSGEGTGQTGSLWPFTLDGGRCLCETLPGFYADIGAAVTARPCDKDGDGWTRVGARSSINSPDPVMTTNARCEVRTVDRIRLVNELQQEKDVMLCLEGLVEANTCTNSDQCGLGRCYGVDNDCPIGVEGCEDTVGVCGCVEAKPLELFESERNDDQEQLDVADGTLMPFYRVGEEGRRLNAEELNSLTRACISEAGDLNDNNVSDVNEWHLMDTSVVNVVGEDPEVQALKATYLQFSYMVELHTAWYSKAPGAEYGTYTIKERSRCDAGFPIQYDPALDGDYWRSCTRNRDSNYDSISGTPQIGFDFAHYSCDDAVEACPELPPVTEMSAEGEIPPHDLCEVALPPADGVWRGMNHHSQFKCVVIDETPPQEPELNPQILLLSELTSDSGIERFQFNRCFAGDSIDATDTGDVVNPSTPDIVCAPETQRNVDGNDVGFVSVRFNDTGYINGCINEWSAWPELCPGYVENPLAVVGQGHVDDFGRLICGCGLQYGGPECDLGCSDNNVSYGGTRGNDEGVCSNGYCSLIAADDAEGRAGFWVCADFAGSTYTDHSAPPQSEGGGYIMQSEVPNSGITQDGPMCQSEDCSAGWSLQ